jgi:hypothetical protein
MSLEQHRPLDVGGRAMLMAQPPSIDAHETTEKGSINQKAVLANRAALVELLYAEPPSAMSSRCSRS